MVWVSQNDPRVHVIPLMMDCPPASQDLRLLCRGASGGRATDGAVPHTQNPRMRVTRCRGCLCVAEATSHT